MNNGFITQISLLGTDYRCWTCFGSLKGCMSEAASLRKFCKGEKFVQMGLGDWQSEHVMIDVFEKKPFHHHDPATKWDGDDFTERLKRKRGGG